MAPHLELPRSPCVALDPAHRWFPADEAFRSTAYEQLLPPLVARIRAQVQAWRDDGYAGATETSRTLLRWWFDTAHVTQHADGSTSPFRWYYAQRGAVESVIWLYDVKHVRDKYDLMRFDASGAVSADMFPEDWPRYVVKTATGAGKTKVLSLLIAWSFFHRLYESGSALARDFLLVARDFLLVARNIIVLDRLRADFDGLRACAPARLRGQEQLLPEQTLGRGLRRMYFGTDTPETVSVMGPPAFMKFVESIRSEGVELEHVPMSGGARREDSLVVEVETGNPDKNLEALDASALQAA